MSVLVGIDIGGTFTDIIGVDTETQEVFTHKLQTTTENHADGFIKGLKQLLIKMEKQEKDISYLFHGTTVGTNSILERKGAKTGLLVTEGFEDILTIGRSKRNDMYNLFMDPETPTFLCPRQRTKGVKERIDSSGTALTSMDEKSLFEDVKDLVENQGVKSIAVNFLFSFMNPEHEKLAERIIKNNYPEVTVSLSSQIDPQFREYERCCLTTFDAYIKPIVGNYLKGLQNILNVEKVKAPLYVMLSHGGISSVRTTIERSVGTLLSGVSAGVLGGKDMGYQIEQNNLITLDVGGTSADVSLVTEAKPVISTEGEINSYPLRQPMVDINTVGAGGGSIAFVDEAKNLKVGPESAGAIPGPACYNLGGKQATVTDASLVLGFLSPEGLAGGKMPLNKKLSESVIEQDICNSLNLDLAKASSGIHKIINASMADAVRLVSIKKGYDPREFSLLSFGGAGGIHVCAVASQLGINRAIIPENSGVLSAYGLLVADMEEQKWNTFQRDTQKLDIDELLTELLRLENECFANIKSDKIDKEHFYKEHVAMMRYIGQSYELPVKLHIDNNKQMDINSTINNFHKLHEQVYGQSNLYSGTEITSIRVTVKRSVAKEKVRFLNKYKTTNKELFHYRDVYFGELDKYIRTPVYEKSAFPTEKIKEGPLIITEENSTTVVPLNWSVRLASNNSLILDYSTG